MKRFWIAAAFGATYIALIRFEPYPGHVLLKAAPMLLLAALAWRQRLPLLVLAFVASAIGDGFLAVDRTALAPALSAFGITQIAYLVTFWRARNPTVTRVILAAMFAAVTLGYLLLFVVPALNGPLRAAIPCYGLLLALMSASAIMSKLPLRVAFGSMMFVAADSLIAWNQFLHPLPHATVLIVTIYFSAQLLIAHGLLCSRQAPQVQGALPA